MEWTKFTSTCISCDREFKVSQQALEAHRVPGLTDEEVASEMTFCLGCASGEEVEGEIVEETEVPCMACHQHNCDGHCQR